MKKTIYLFVDGSNLYGGQYDLFGPGRYLSFPKFIDEAEDHLKINLTESFFMPLFLLVAKCLIKNQNII